jgi:hypothetical protein
MVIIEIERPHHPAAIIGKDETRGVLAGTLGT